MPAKTKKHILIIANGQPPEINRLNALVHKSDLIIAADGGSNLCFQRKITPDYIIGDLDSIQPHVEKFYKNVELIHRPDQNFHDLEKALDFAQTFNPDVVRIAAAFGKKSGHTLANLILLQTKMTSFKLEYYDDYGCVSLIQKEHVLNLPPGSPISLFSFLPVSGLTLKGFKYTLSNANFKDGFNGLSNEITHTPALIHIKKGALFLYLPYENT